MKQFISIFIISFLLSSVVSAQVPQQFNYQAVARNAAGIPISNQSVKVRLTIHAETSNGSVRYAETRTVTTNGLGLFTVIIGGDGALDVTGSMGAIDFYSADHFLQVEIDINNGNNFTNMGTTQLLSVPYALQSQKANMADNLKLPLGATLSSLSPLISLENPGSGQVIYAGKGLSGATVANAAIVGETNGQQPGIAGYSHGSNGVYGYSNSTDGVLGLSNGGGTAGIKGITTHSHGVGVEGNSSTGEGVLGTSQAGVGGHFRTITGIALKTSGKIQFNHTGETVGKTLMVDEFGSANWEGGIAFGVAGLPTALDVPNATYITIPFAVINYNTGSHYRNRNEIVDPNTLIIPVTGIYHFDAALLWESFSVASGSAIVNLMVNGSPRVQSRQASATGRQSSTLSCDVLLNAGDKVTIAALQSSGATQTMPNILGSFFNGRFVMKN